MADYRLTRTQKNTIYKLFNKHGLSPAQFKWEDRGSSGAGQYSRIRHVSENCFFEYGANFTSDGHGFCTYRPAGRAALHENFIVPGELLLHADHWAECVAQELSEPDLWAQLESYSLEIPEASREQLDSGRLFEADKKRIRLVMEEVRERARESNLAPQQLEVINAKLDYLVEATDRVTLKDWAILVVGTLMTMAAEAAIDKGVYQTIIDPLWNLIVSGVRLLKG